MSQLSALCCIALIMPLCGCSCKTAEHLDTASNIDTPVIRVHGDFGLMAGAYDIVVSGNGHVAYSNYPLSVMRTDLGSDEVARILSAMREVGFWRLDSQALSNAVSDVVVQDATKLTLTAFWKGEARTVSFERDSVFSPVVEKCAAVKTMRRCVEFLESGVIASEFP